MFKDVNGKISAKRVNAFICIVAGVVIGIVGLIFKSGSEYMWPCFVAGGALLGVTIGEKPKAGIDE